MAVLVLLNNFLHDFSAAGWIFGAVILWSILRQKPPANDRDPEVKRILRLAMLLMRYCLAGIVVFGVVRALAYKTYEWSQAAGDGQVTLLIVKHGLLTLVFVVGLVVYLRAKKEVSK